MGEFFGVWRQVEMPSAPVVIRKPVNEGECPALSLVIAVHNQWQYTERCLETLFADMPQVEVVVVDNGSTDETPQRLAAYGGVRHIRLEQNVGVGPAWNLGLAACDSPVVGVLNNDVVIHEGGMRALADAAWRTGIAAHVGGTLDEQCNFRGFTANGWDADYADGAALLFRRDVMEEVGLFDEAFAPAYCLVPETKVLKADLTWVPIGDLVPGDSLVGIDEHPPKQEEHPYQDRRYRVSTVLETSRRVAPCVRVTMSDGRQVVCTEDHKWLTKLPVPSGDPYKWRQTRSLRPGCRISVPLDVWDTDNSRDGGWLAGIMDGEGYIRSTNGKTFGIGIAQNPGLVLDEIFSILKAKGITFTSRFHSGENGVVNIEISNRRHVMKALGSLRPVRLLANSALGWVNRSPRSRQYPAAMEIVSIEPAGEREVVTIETSTHTFIAEGMASHNCEDADWSLRARLKGWEFALCPTALEHVGQATAKQFKDLRERMEKNRTLLSARYSRLGVGQRVAVHRHGALGDVIMVTPAIRAMKMALPLARVWLECAPIIADAMQGIRCVDGVSPKAPFTVTRQVELDRAYEDLDHAGVWPHPVRQYGEILGYGMGLGRMEVPEDPQAAEWAASILAHVSLPIVACVLRSAHRPKANWSERQWLRLAQLMPHRVLVAIDPEPRPQLEPFGVYRGARFFDEPNVIDLTGKTPSVRAVFEVIRKAAVCVSVDTGPMHAAAAMDIPLVAICGGSPGWSRVPFSGKVRVLQGKAPCYPCVCPSQCEERPQTGHCLSVIEARDVAFAVDDLTGRRMLVKEGAGRLRVER